jgi:hypothetical protein
LVTCRNIPEDRARDIFDVIRCHVQGRGREGDGNFLCDKMKIIWGQKECGELVENESGGGMGDENENGFDEHQ